MAKILLVDDDHELCQLYKIRLEEAGYQISTVYDGEDALKKIQEKKPDLIILDLMLPKISGIEVLKKLKQDKKFQTIPIIIFSALDNQQDKVKIADSYLIKSKTLPQKLIGEIERLLK